MEGLPLNHKRCCSCKKGKPTTDFNKHLNTYDGLQCNCIECGKAYAKARYKKNIQNALYLIEHPSEEGYVKVGTTNNPSQKIHDYNYASPTGAFSFARVYYLEEPKTVERAVLEHFVDQRHHSNNGKQGVKKRDWVKAPLSDIVSFIEDIFPQIGASRV